MSQVVRNSTLSADSMQPESSLLDLMEARSDGWSMDDLKKVCSSAQSLKSQKSAACIKAVAKMALLSKQCRDAPKSLAQILFSLNPGNKLIRENNSYIVVEVAANFRLPRIPLGYAFKGGAARIALAHVVGRDTKHQAARDFDLVRFSKGSIAQDRTLAARVMPEDFSHGHGVEVVGSLEQYFESRDLTINEVLLIGKKVIFSRTAFDDLRNGILRPSAALVKNNAEIPGKTVCKILRLAAELEAAGTAYELIDFPKGLKISGNELERQRVKAAQLGSEVEEKYLKLCALNLSYLDYQLSVKKVQKKPVKMSTERTQTIRFFKSRRG